ncbi:MAG: hypothetical protein Kow0022_18740 [Phycisphaerales bacterium]
MIRRHRPTRCRGFTLIEAVIIVVMLAIVVPTSTVMLMDASAERTDRVLLQAGVTYASSLLEQIVADVSAGGLDVLADQAAYLDAPDTGLWARCSWLSAPYAARGIKAEVTISEQVSRTGEVSLESDENRFRIVEVSVGVPTASGGILTVPISVMLGEPNP